MTIKPLYLLPLVLAGPLCAQSIGQGSLFTPCASPSNPCTVQAGPQSASTPIGGSLVLQGTPNGAQIAGSTVAGSTLVMGANNPSASQPSFTSSGGDVYIGGGVNTPFGSNDAIEGQDHHMTAWRLGATSTPGLVYCVSGHYQVDICTSPQQIPVGVMPPSNYYSQAPFVNPLGAGIWVQWGGSLAGVKSASWQSFTTGDRVCTDPENPGYVIDNGLAQCSCPSQQIGVSRQTDAPLNMHSVEIILGGCQ